MKNIFKKVRLLFTSPNWIPVWMVYPENVDKDNKFVFYIELQIDRERKKFRFMAFNEWLEKTNIDAKDVYSIYPEALTVVKRYNYSESLF
jgi:hypothetical protein